MTTVDVLIIAITVYAIWRCRLVGASKRLSAVRRTPMIARVTLSRDLASAVGQTRSGG
jgi:hypothetical protein